MKIAILILAQVLSSNGAFQPIPKPPVLQCGQYQHQQYTPAHCADTCDSYGTACTTQCLYVAPVNECVDDIHFVTERDWQMLLENQDHIKKALQGLLNALDHQANVNDKVIRGLTELDKKKADR